MNQQLLAWRQRAVTFLDQRSPSERRALVLLAWAVALAIVGQAAWSLEHARRAQLRQLPLLAASAERVAALRSELQQLGDAAATQAMRSDVLQTTLAPRLSELGPDIAANWPAAGQLQLSGEVDFAVWVRWTAAMQGEYRLVLERCRISGSSGRVRIEASYRATGSSA